MTNGSVQPETEASGSRPVVVQMGVTLDGFRLAQSRRSADEYRLVIHPVVIGNGTSLFRALREPLRLAVVEARTFPTGTSIQVCRPLEED
jgi:dihydrofolate reductase